MNTQLFSIKNTLARISSGEATCREIVSECLKKINESNATLNALVRVYDDALEVAENIDKRIKAGEDVGQLCGVPIIIKDNILSKGRSATAGSQILEGHISAYSATVVERLENAGAVIIGSSNMDEFAMGSSTETSHYGATKNPWDNSRVPGGSSGGSAAAVAAGFSPCALGSDTGGSIRQPASLCGVVGLKPTYGRVSRYGLMAMASSLDQVGPLTRTVEDAAHIMHVIEGKDSRDATSVELKQTSLDELITPSVEGLRIGVPNEYFIQGMDSRIKEIVMSAIDVLAKAGAQVKEISMPHVEFALATYYVLMPCEASSNLGRFDGLRYGYHSEGTTLEDTYMRTRAEGFGAEVKRRIMLGSFALSAGYYDAYYRKALKMRSLIKRDFDEALKEVDVIVTPTSPSVAWGLGEKFDDPITMYLSDIYTITANLATVPAMSVPCGFVDGLPVGMQFMARAFDEETIYQAGMFYQSQTDWHLRTP